ncbi:MAG: hypothetical protein L6Q54_06070 [Leptospiraceae bacterium]|nr:hypothetical protein [Leptospiraceae bacterium]MCK6380802.1 hypothetical protein [Leptospiraceae bacterium]NUM42157.1 hypothetical protein [Leptospiraceae bacterium]
MKFFIAIFLTLFAWNCAIDNTVDSFDAQSQVNAAVQFKVDKCNEEEKKNHPSSNITYFPPQPWLYIVNNPIRRNLDLCTIAITKSECPFLNYPLICMYIYQKKEVGKFPNIIFNEFIKFKIK